MKQVGGVEAYKDYLLLQDEVKSEMMSRYGFFIADMEKAYDGTYYVPEFAIEETGRILAQHVLSYLYINFAPQRGTHEEVLKSLVPILTENLRIDPLLLKGRLSETLISMVEEGYIQEQEGVYSIQPVVRGFMREYTLPPYHQEMSESDVVQGYDFLYSPTPEDLSKNFEKLKRDNPIIGLYDLNNIKLTRELFEWMYHENRELTLVEIAQFLGFEQEDPTFLYLRVTQYLDILLNTSLVSMSAWDRFEQNKPATYRVSPVTYVALIKRKKVYPKNR